METLQEKTVLRPASVPTGIVLLDRRLDGGLPAGSLVCLYADPIAMPEAFLYQFASVTKSYYFNTSRSPTYIIRDMKMLRLETDNVNFVDVYSQYFLNDYGHFVIEDRYRDKEIFDFMDENINRIQGNKEECVLVIDSLSFFLQLNVEWGLKDWLLNKLYVFTKETGNLAYVYLIKDLHPVNVVKKVLDLCDVVFDIEAARMGEKVVSKFAIPKLRGKQPITEYFRFYIDEGVQIDTARDIA